MPKKKTTKKKKDVRLSKDVVASVYDIKLHPDLENFTFAGEETIALNIKKSTKTITLHSKEIDIDVVNLKKGREMIFADKISYQAKDETATFHFKKAIRPGRYKLEIYFKGILNDKMRGFYRSSYIWQGQVHHMATTQFEATDARRAFPCFDEPAHKAVFHVSLVVPKGKTAISNTLPVSKIEHEAGFEVVRFAPSPKMSTYLLAFIVGDFEYIEKKSKRGVKVRVLTTPGKKHQARFALDTTVKVLDFYEKYFDIPYPLDTLDTIAIPDFQSGAMENWGAITYRESAVLVDETHSSTSNKEWVALVIAHELAHQWFGNLVTMEWWTHLWLNEGFASYIEYLAVDKIFPKWNIWMKFLNNDLGVAFKLDALANTHPIEVEVHHPDEIGEIFDAVSYSKGASVIRMLADYIGEKNFRDGLRYYLKKHSYKNTETIHLWEAFEKVSKKPVEKIMRNWTSRSGYPLVEVSKNKDKVELSQSRFFSSPLSQKKNKENTTWQIPLLIQEGRKKTDFLLEKKRDTLLTKSSLVKVNETQSSVCRVLYSEELLEEIKEEILSGKASTALRLGIIRDLFALAEAGKISTIVVLRFLEAYRKEENYNIWAEISAGLGKVKQMLAKTKAEEGLNRFIISLYSPVYKKLGWSKKKSESNADTLLRSMVIAQLGACGEERVIVQARKKFAQLKRGWHIDPDLRSAIYSIVASSGKEKDYRALVKMYKEEELHEEKNRIGASLGRFKDERILCKVVEFSISKNVRIQDTAGILTYVGLNPAGRMIWLKFMKYNWQTLLERYAGGHTLSRLVKGISHSFEEKNLKYFKDFIKKNKTPGAERAVEQVLEQLESNIAWAKRDKKEIASFLK